ncbi:MAG: caspase family protein, partial [Deltaproteobacteria bacterium]
MRTSQTLTWLAFSGAVAVAAPPAFAQRARGDVSVSAALSARDGHDADGHFFRTRAVNLRAGTDVAIRVDSAAFDTVVHVTGPQFDETNDDAEGEGTNSRLAFHVATSGAYRVTVTTYTAGETGAYSLAIHQGPASAGGAVEPAAAQAPAEIAPEPGAEMPDGSGVDEAAGTAAQPQGWVWDDAQHMFVSSGAAPSQPADVNGATDGQGTNEEPSNGNPFVPGVDAAGGTGTVYGVFVGVSNYGGGNDLDDTAADARNLAGAFEHAGLVRHGNAIVLTDGEATGDQVRQAFRTLAARVTARDTFVFFFDGHGDTNEVELQSGALTAEELSQLLDGVRGQQLVVLDSCNSGSLASVVRGHPNRFGLFSSRANETSYVASEVHAGGWLAWFTIQAVRQQVAARD